MNGKAWRGQREGRVRPQIAHMTSKHDPRLELSELLKAYDERDALRAENEWLREALAEITELDLEGDASLSDAIKIADEALNPY